LVGAWERWRGGGGLAEHLDGTAAPVDGGDLDADLIAGDYGAPEAGAVDAGEDHEGALGVGELGEDEDAADLGDGFDDEDTGHDGIAREVALEEGLIDGDVLDGDDALFSFDLEDAVDEEERVAMGEDGHDAIDVHHGLNFCWRFGNNLFIHSRDEYKWGRH
jgi:hypothetical protein